MNRLQREDFVIFYASHYAARNTVIAVAERRGKYISKSGKLFYSDAGA